MLLVGAITMHAATGKACSDAIPLGKDYSEKIDGPTTVWYVAKTFDLPIKVCFSPLSPSAPAPVVAMDFTCNPGVYLDSILCSLFCKGNTTGVTFDMPHYPKLEMEDGAYCISMGKRYRDLLLQAGISYNVDVYVKVTFNSAGTISMVPDTEFADCMDGGKFMQLGDTVKVKAKDKDRHVILPYVQWSKDSIRYIWQGTAPLSVAIANTCGIDPTDYTDERIIDRIEMQPVDTACYTADSIKYYAEFENAQAGMYYGKFYSNGTGVLKIERVPVAPPDGGAVLLKYDKPTTIYANDINTLYAMRRDTNAIRFDSPTNHVLKIYFGATADFTPETAIASYQFIANTDAHTLMLTAKEIENLWRSVTGNYIYIRFATTARTTVTPAIWTPSECASKWNELPKGNTSITRLASDAVYYKLVYAKWKDGNITIKINGSAKSSVYVGDTCSFATTDAIYTGDIARRGTLTIPAATVNAWAEYVDDEGNLYILFDPSSNTTITVSSTAPEEQDPTYPSATIHVACISEANANIQISVSVAQQLTITNAVGMVVQQWNATTAAPQKILLSTGIYTLKGDNEQITIVL